MRRDRSMTAIRFMIHFLVAGLIGVMYIGIGNDASHAYNNFKYIFFSIMFLMFTAFSSTQMTCKRKNLMNLRSKLICCISVPVELSIIRREHFNHWYSLKAYYIAKLVASDIPIQIICAVI
jgi:ATP-binding cassette subfamily G (WHITE) protein 1